MFDRLGEKLRSYLDNANDDIFSNIQNSNFNDGFDNDDIIDDLFDDGEEKPVESGWHYTPGNSFQNEKKEKQTDEKPLTSEEWQAYQNAFTQKFSQQFSKHQNQEKKTFSTERLKPYPKILERDFLKLGVTPGSSIEVCKTAQIKLLKTFHPDKMENSSELEKVKANIMCSLVNESFTRIKSWYETGKVGN